MIISSSILLRMRIFRTKFVEKIKTISFSITFFLFCRVVYMIMWKNVVDLDRLQITIYRMQMAYWILKTTDTHSVYVTFTAFPQQQLLHERVYLLHYVLLSRSALVALIDFAGIPASWPWFKTVPEADYHNRDCVVFLASFSQASQIWPQPLSQILLI